LNNDFPWVYSHYFRPRMRIHTSFWSHEMWVQTTPPSCSIHKTLTSQIPGESHENFNQNKFWMPVANDSCNDAPLILTFCGKIKRVTIPSPKFVIRPSFSCRIERPTSRDSSAFSRRWLTCHEYSPLLRKKGFAQNTRSLFSIRTRLWSRIVHYYQTN
jgi:hypothetical protein